MKNVLETERLCFRELRGADADALFALDSDPDVVRYVGEPPLTHVDQARQRIARVMQHYQDYGLGRYAAVLKESNAFIGWAGLKYIAELNDRKDIYDLGYRFLPAHWGQGYATESARAFIGHGFDELKLRCISAYADVNHVASAKVLQKCGMTWTNNFMEGEDWCAWYERVNAGPKSHTPAALL